MGTSSIRSNVLILRNVSQTMLSLPWGRISHLFVSKFAGMPDKGQQKLSKPRMKGLLQRQIMVNVGIAITLGVVTGALFKFFVADVRKKKYADFYRDYDPESDMTAMLKLGADFQSCADFH